jgi:HEAT repeat protein
MLQLLTFAILGIGAAFLGLILIIVANKARREVVDAGERARRAELEPAVLAYVHGEAESLALSLPEVPDRRDRRVLERILLDHAQLVRGIDRQRLARALEELGFVDQQLSALRGGSWWQRAEAAEKLGLAGSSRAVRPLCRALDDPAAEVRMRVAKALGRLGGEASARRLIRALGQPSRWSTIRIADILARMGGDVVGLLIEAYPDMTVPARLATLDVLARIRPLGATRWLVERLDEPQRDLRARACHALGSLGDPAAAAPLIEALRDRQWPVRAMAAKALGRIRQAEAIPSLCAALRDERWWVRSNAADALTLMGRPGVDALEEMLADADRYARHQVALKLEELGVVDERADQLSRGREPQRSAAEALILRFVSAGRTGRLRALAASHPDHRVRRALGRLLPPEGEAA